MSSLLRRTLVATAVAGALVVPTALAANAATAGASVGVGGEVCTSLYSNTGVTAYGQSNPNIARFTLTRNGAVVFQTTAYAVVTSSFGPGQFTFCGKNKLGNTGASYIQVSLS